MGIDGKGMGVNPLERVDSLRTHLNWNRRSFDRRSGDGIEKAITLIHVLKSRRCDKLRQDLVTQELLMGRPGPIRVLRHLGNMCPAEVMRVLDTVVRFVVPGISMAFLCCSQ